MDFCPRCGRSVQPEAAFCPKCGTLLTGRSSFSSRAPYQTFGTDAINQRRGGKNPWLAAVLSLVLGFFGIWGIGDMYAGKWARGIGLLICGLIIGALFWLSVVFTVIPIGYVGMVLFGIFFLGGWLWQALDAYNSAAEFNELYVTPQKTSW